ncbi:hypothetical protein ACGFYU_16805 [Streptomyces sp. NPDC048337]|uniref:hypothetical protein n=1 Tax=Streptomyces sp. NPDC048337 TaxID=3365535 RepID=UPI00371E7060
MGRPLIVVAPIVAIGVLYSLYSNWHWSEGELRAAVHEAADALNPKPRYTNRDAPQDDLVRAAVPETGAGPGPGVRVRGNGTAGYTINTEHTGAAFCMRLSLTPVDTAAPFPAALERRSGWGTQRYVYNHRNPSGMALILITTVVTIGVVIGFHSGSQWRRLRPVVRSCV